MQNLPNMRASAPGPWPSKRPDTIGQEDSRARRRQQIQRIDGRLGLALGDDGWRLWGRGYCKPSIGNSRSKSVEPRLDLRRAPGEHE